jgi:hypothetical protein
MKITSVKRPVLFLNFGNLYQVAAGQGSGFAPLLKSGNSKSGCNARGLPC